MIRFYYYLYLSILLVVNTITVTYVFTTDLTEAQIWNCFLFVVAFFVLVLVAASVQILVTGKSSH